MSRLKDEVNELKEEIKKIKKYPRQDIDRIIRNIPSVHTEAIKTDEYSIKKANKSLLVLYEPSIEYVKTKLDSRDHKKILVINGRGGVLHNSHRLKYVNFDKKTFYGYVNAVKILKSYTTQYLS